MGAASNGLKYTSGLIFTKLLTIIIGIRIQGDQTGQFSPIGLLLEANYDFLKKIE